GGGGTPYFDCAGVKNGKAIESPCGCIGGTTGIESCAQKEIIDSVKNPCLKASLSLAISNGVNNQITGYMNSTFGTSSQRT
ncbi:hypothetical protein EV200_1168, partial [Pedobacter psychrotolerans]